MLQGLLLALFSSLVMADNVVTCAGQVTASGQLNALDFGLVTVHLFSYEGLLKYSAQCSPEGQYFIPVFDQGSFYLGLEGPEGWAFDRDRFDFTVSADGGCAEDINFEFAGFSVSGYIRGESLTGAECEISESSDVRFDLFQDGADAGPVQTAIGSGGRFSLTNVFPGSYELRASHDHYKLSTASRKVVVGLENFVIEEPFLISGFALSGSVVSSSDQGVPDVTVFLYSTSGNIDFLDCAPPPASANFPTKAGTPICAATTDATGMFSFPGLSCGEYELVPFQQAGSASFDVFPTQVVTSMGAGDSVASPAFRVMGFSAPGRVVNAQGNGVAGVAVSLNGVVKAVTDHDGNYKADQLSEGQGVLTASKDKMSFTTADVFLNGRNPTLPDLTVTSYAICGKINLMSPSGTRTLRVTDQASKSVISVNTDDDLSYCFDAAPGSYEIIPVVSYSEQSQGLLLSPKFAVITVIDAPVPGLDFSEARVTVSGQVSCLASCEGVSVSLSSSLLTKKTTTDDSGNFAFSEVIPGSYQVQVVHANWCWEEDTIPVHVQHEDQIIQGLTQTGFELVLSASHPTLVHVNGPIRLTFDADQGDNSVCLSAAGVYLLSADSDSCFRFDKSLKEFATDDPRPIVLTASATFVKGEVHINADSQGLNIQEIPISYSFNGKDMHATSASKVGDSLLFAYNFWAPLDSRMAVSIAPVAESSPINTILFNPNFVSALPSQTCPIVMETISGQVGVFLSGSTSPAVSGATVQVTNGDDVTTGLTDASGAYRVGPLFETEDYTVTLHAHGYAFTSQDGLNFVATKLAQLRVELADTQGAIVMLSGKGIRYNNRTESGDLLYPSLPPGEYIVRPLLKEYEFSPAVQTIDLQPEQTETASFSATRVAFSVFGTVRTLVGEPLAGIVVEAREDKLASPRAEEAESDSEGNFHIRGLQPGSTYIVTVKSGPPAVDRSYPMSHTVLVSAEDTMDIDFIAFPPLTKFDLMGTVNMSSVSAALTDAAASRPTLHNEQEITVSDDVELTLEVTTLQGKVLNVASVTSAVPFFVFPGLPLGKYQVRLRPSKNPAMTFTADTLSVTLDGHTDVLLQINAEAIITQNDVPVDWVKPIFVLACVLLFINRKHVLTLINEQLEAADSTPTPAPKVKKSATNRVKRRR
jgi:hypothetical protein